MRKDVTGPAALPPNRCPAHINIPEYLRACNSGKIHGEWTVTEKLAQVESRGKPGTCIACGACIRHCPQGIDIPAMMKKLSQMAR